MKFSKKFTINMVIIISVLAIDAIIAIIYGATLPAASEKMHDTIWQYLIYRAEVIMADPVLLADHIFYIISIIGFGIVLLMMLNMRQQLIRPLISAVKFALELAENRFPRKLEVPAGNNEITELVTSLNFMRDNLQSTFLKLQTSHENEKNARFSAELLTQLKGGFIQHITPDILESIDTIKSYIEIIRRHEDNKNLSISTDEAYEAISVALSLQIRHLDRLQDLCKIGIDKTEFDMKPIRSADFLARIVRITNELLISRQIKVSYEYNSSMPEAIVTDQEILRMIMTMAIQAIADNAEAGELILCRCSKSDNDVVFSIKDQKLTLMRDPLYQLYNEFISSGADISNADKRLITLVVLREWVESMNGYLELISDGDDSNLEIKIIFIDLETPNNIASEAFGDSISRRLASVRQDVPRELFTPTPAKILLAESNNEIRRASECILAADKHDTTCVNAISSIKKLIKSTQFDLIVISLHISVTTIKELAREIKSSEKNQDATIMIINNDINQSNNEILNSDIKYVFTRPLDFEHLRQISGRCKND